MKRTLLIFLGFLVVFSLSVASVSAESCNIDVSLVNQDPYPAIPGSYVEVLFEVAGVENPECGEILIDLDLDYPFSLDPDDSSLQTLEGGTYSANRNNVWIIPYDILVDEDAVDKEYDIKVKRNNGVDGDLSITELFNISVEDIRTDFDLVFQESTGNEVSIAIANTGKNAANSLIVRIPEQDGFSISGTNGQMVGNLDSGDYSIVGFTIVSNGRGSAESLLKVQMDYTDSIGERRSVIKEIPFNQQSSFQVGENGEPSSGQFQRGNFQGGRSGQQSNDSSFFKSFWFWVIIIVLVGGGVYVYKKHPRKVKELIDKIRKNKSKIKDKSGEIPGWIKNGMDKEKTK